MSFIEDVVNTLASVNNLIIFMTGKGYRIKQRKLIL
jgi:hypothetical protein